MDNRRKWEYTLAEIAEASGVSVHTVRDHRLQGHFDPGNLESVARYITAYRAVNNMKSVVDDVDEFGEPRK